MTKAQNKGILKTLGIILLIYFVVRPVLVTLYQLDGPGITKTSEIVNLIVIAVISLFGLFAAYNLLRFREWALTALIALFLVQITYRLIYSAYFLGGIGIPTGAIVFLIILIVISNRLEEKVEKKR